MKPEELTAIDWKIIRFLLNGDNYLQEIWRQTGISSSTLSINKRNLVKMKLIDSYKKGSINWLSLTPKGKLVAKLSENMEEI